MAINGKNRYWLLLPVGGTILFAALYFLAACFYPGGSQANANARGFSWVNNYWCNLLNEKAINGQSNAARPIALLAMIVLGSTLSAFWLLFAGSIRTGKVLKYAIGVSGVLSMAGMFFLLTATDHDLVINISSALGLLAVIGTLIGLYARKWFGLFTWGMVNLLLVAVNNYVYYNKELLFCLPVIQKITFAAFLAWVCFISFRLYSKGNNE
ncbi:MAG: hypothetical protein JNL59_07805 [Chitinophagaceae bacterium]|nr:hypothetical protein [Chitinophagaceae bacterium]